MGKGFAFLFEMGCGKTATAIATMGAMYRLGKIERVLIVAPTSVCNVWPHELEDFAEFKFRAALLSGDKQHRIDALHQLEDWPFRALKVAVINYESSFRDGIDRELTEYDADLIICDESQRIKNHAAKQSKMMHTLGDRARYKLILSGTPVQNSPTDLFSQYRFMDPAVFGTNFYTFRARNCIMGGYQNHQVIGYRDLNALIRQAHSVALRVTKEECLDLPDKIFESRYIELTPSERKLYDSVRKASFAELENGGTLTATTVLTKLLRLQQITGGFLQPDDGAIQPANTAKLKALEDILDDYVIETGKKLVIFARFRPEIDAIEKLLEKKGIRYGCIFGDVPLETRRDSDGKVITLGRDLIVDDFQKNPETEVFVAQLQTAGLGITLHAASVAVFYSVDFNYANYAQACDRIHRIGMDVTQPATYIHLMVEKSIDDIVMKALEQKKDIAKTVVDDWKTYF